MKWAKATGLTPAAVHRLWREASYFANEADDDSKIELLDVSSLAKRGQFLIVTSAGPDNCLTLTVLKAEPSPYRKVWTEQQTPERTGFCDKPAARAEVEVTAGIIRVGLPIGEDVVQYEYGWDKNTYRFIGSKRVPRSSKAAH